MDSSRWRQKKAAAAAFQTLENPPLATILCLNHCTEVYFLSLCLSMSASISVCLSGLSSLCLFPSVSLSHTSSLSLCLFLSLYHGSSHWLCNSLSLYLTLPCFCSPTFLLSLPLSILGFLSLLSYFSSLSVSPLPLFLCPPVNRSLCISNSLFPLSS